MLLQQDAHQRDCGAAKKLNTKGICRELRESIERSKDGTVED
jgi:hypothetical protein